jgi:hypothetical protein
MLQQRNSAPHVEVKHASRSGSRRRPERVLVEQVRVLVPAVEEV